MKCSSISVIILTKNEAIHIARAIYTVSSLNCKVFVVDSFSDDLTPEIAKDAGACVVQHKFINYALQFQWALDNLPIESEWVMRLDADETLTSELIEEIKDKLHLLSQDITGVVLRRRHIFLGRWIRHGGRYPLTLLRIWRKGAAKIEQRWMDEHMVLLYGRAVTFYHDFTDHNLNDLTFFTDKHNKYATREAIDVLMTKYRICDDGPILNAETTSVQASAKRWVKSCIYNRLPIWLGPILYFIYRYFFQLGFLDGREGLTYHFLQGFWYRFLVAAKVMEFDGALKPLPDESARLAELAVRTGYVLSDLEWSRR
ncbi:glycosyltransferase family 2 protein [Methylosinus sporium]|uniref:glycosyltransferase family 2 protein n=1 Tax=Methylosinus sporium TaxID=428 RepID=UPI00383A758B